ncbi:hypothetical protein FOXG_14298 [Fusarium oxysporum f. sp. lycopersici 4287]|uniref:Alpha/beta hydrolase fold-3 domain-containing protein n=1 Tax=Fusarium oxysporum f. sp. lycopersici (strain 4287 / CBS 123668 / FGSC 9935 / NRRL 34936) TaxID=426428 RepID=A0A0J9VYW6_FUSO4|nr:hypothetical protein FOXG_14298 [Fusarium oxysporum f. sp. lycopersici 4287]EWZ78226.1 hypothetical protein FOWG_17462 [Fusarium oxysporum f. sp. lycopersici MN25]KAJ9413691.1 Alpha/Beta hydrolase protein [Fusarium oxysporum]KNB15991.1 hypothetical protein FOXG_14298 [Fusarium oxysporum f. sp. lycopersici 4287]
MGYRSPLSRLPESASGLTKQEYKITSADGIEVSLWRIATCSAGENSTRQPAMIYVHGGAFIFRNIDMKTVILDKFNNSLVSRLGLDPLHEAGCVLLYVSYRIATEKPFPAPAEDVYAAYKYTLTHAAELGILEDKICIMGVSAGANLAWVATHMALDRGLSGSCGLMAIYPMLDPDTTWNKHEGETRQDEKDTLRRGWDRYLSRLHGLPAEQQKYARLLLLSTKDLDRLPPTHVDVGSHDYFKEEVLRAMDMLRDANINLTAKVLEGMPHNFESGLYKLEPRNEVLQKTWDSRRLFLQKIFGLRGL